MTLQSHVCPGTVEAFQAFQSLPRKLKFYCPGEKKNFNHVNIRGTLAKKISKGGGIIAKFRAVTDSPLLLRKRARAPARLRPLEH